ncbi:MAG: Peptidase family, partial [Marmoricola sp.]|nr:Peptidase family [Marmoricola sp.]
MSSTRLSRAVLGVVVLGLLAAPTLVAAGADAKPVAAAKRSSSAPNVAFPVASSRAVDLRLFGGRPGTEIQAPCGSIVRSATPGTAHVGASTTSGKNLVWVVTSKDKLTTYYGYMDSSLVKEGQILQSGQRIGTVGKQ